MFEDTHDTLMKKRRVTPLVTPPTQSTPTSNCKHNGTDTILNELSLATKEIEMQAQTLSKLRLEIKEKEKTIQVFQQVIITSLSLSRSSLFLALAFSFSAHYVTIIGRKNSKSKTRSCA